MARWSRPSSSAVHSKRASPPPGSRPEQLHRCEAEPAIIDAVHLTGPYDYQLTVRCADTTELDTSLIRLKEQHQVERTDTRIVLADPIRRDPDPQHR